MNYSTDLSKNYGWLQEQEKNLFEVTMKYLTMGVLAMSVNACTTKERFEVSRDTVQPASKIDWVGNETALLGEGKLKLNDLFPPIDLVNESMAPERIKPDGKVKFISILPSLDTEICDQQTHLLSETTELNKNVDRITISKDLPYAQRRFAAEAKLQNVRYFSDYKSGDLGRTLGLEIERNGLLARAIVIVDGEGVVKYFQIMPKIYTLPDMAKAINIANELSQKH